MAIRCRAGAAVPTNTPGPAVLGYGIFNQAAISFADADGNGHVVVLGDGIRRSAGAASAGLVCY